MRSLALQVNCSMTMHETAVLLPGTIEAVLHAPSPALP